MYERAARTLTAVDGRADFISNLEVNLKVWSEFYDLP